MTMVKRDQDGAIVTLDDAIQTMEGQFALAVRRRELLAEYITNRLTPSHFYKPPGARKPSLTKEGAEAICLPHGLKARYDWVSGPADPPDGDTPYQITIKCRLFNLDGDAGEGMGSANSHITKQNGERIPRQKDHGLRHNATLKMAEKSSYIAATLGATAASEFFTQDMEDAKEEAHDDSEHWCQAHSTAFFMRGKMKSFAHPIGDDGEWCNQAEELRAEKATPNSLAKQYADLAQQLDWDGSRTASFIKDQYGSTWAGITEGERVAAVDALREMVNQVIESPPQEAEAEGKTFSIRT
jgi:hypothetical protein